MSQADRTVKVHSRRRDKRGKRSGRFSTRGIYRKTGAPPAGGKSRGERELPPVAKDRAGMGTDYHCRLAPKNIARIRLTEKTPGHFWIDWVFVPPAYRAHGLGRVLMKEVTADADAMGIRLSLEARACAGLSQEALEGWYAKQGFVKTPFRGDFGPILVREPQAVAQRRAA